MPRSLEEESELDPKSRLRRDQEVTKLPRTAI